jgi:hypothetical protein
MAAGTAKVLATCGVGALIRWSQIDAQDEHAVFDDTDRVTDDREVHVVGLLLLQEVLSLGTGDRWERPRLDGSGAVAEPVDERVDVEAL